MRVHPDEFRIEPLSTEHERAGFTCGVPALDAYLQRQAGQDVRKRVAAAFVATPDGLTIAGFYTLSQFAVDSGDLPVEIARKLPKYPIVPATLLGRLAVSMAFRGRGLGERLLTDALTRTLQMSREIASIAVVVDAKDEAGIAFYRKYGFIEIPRIQRRLFLPMATIERVIEGR